MYLSIPKGMKYKLLTIDGVNKDCFVDVHDESHYIIFQDILKEAIRHVKGGKKELDCGEFTIYLRHPPCTNIPYIKYIAHNNGKFFTEKTVETAQGSYAKQANTTYGTFWYSNLPLTDTQKAELYAKRAEQQANKRHIGDSPCPT